jgi:hypothetical protein
MACKNPPSVDLEKFVCHIWNDVRWFVQAVRNYERCFNNDKDLPPNTIVAYLDSALLHGRSLVEFFNHAPTNYPDVRACHYLLSSFPCTEPMNTTLGDWKKAADTKLAHLTANRDAAPIGAPIVSLVPQPTGDPLNHWEFQALWLLLRPSFEKLANNSLIPNTLPKFKELLAEADKILAG